MKERFKYGKALKRVGKFLLTVGVLIVLVFLTTDIEIDGYLSVIIWLSVFIIPLGAFLYWRGRQYIASTISKKIISDLKSHVIYLRDFKTDPSTFSFVFSPDISERLISGLRTTEDELREVLMPFGELVAIGRPDEKLPTPGAARLYASDVGWKKVISDQMKSASLVIIRAGSGQGLLWELRQAVQILDPKKLLIFFLNMKKKDYLAFRQNTDLIFKGNFPEYIGSKLFFNLSGFISFSSNWEPKFLQLRAPFFRRDPNKSNLRLFKYTLKPVFKEHGLEWEPPTISKLMVAYITILFGGFLLIVILLLSSLT